MRTKMFRRTRLALGAAALAALLPQMTMAAPPSPVADRVARGKVILMGQLTSGPPKMDGSLDDWGRFTTPSLCLDEKLDHIAGPLRAGRTDAAAVRVARDDKALYIAARVVDPDVVTDAGTVYAADSVELFLDLRPLAPSSGPRLGDAKYSDGAYQISISPPSDAGHPLKWLLGAQARPLGDIAVAGRRLPDGYLIEVRLPYAGMNGVTASRFDQPVGLDVSVNEADTLPGGTGYSDRITYSLGGSPDHWQDAGVFGVTQPTTETAGVVTRTVPGRLIEGTGERRIVAGLIAAPSALAGRPAMSLALTRDGKDAAPGIPATTETSDFPSLGVSVTRAALTLQRLDLGRYTVVTGAGAGPARTSTFETLSWQAAGPPPAPRAARVLPDQSDSVGASRLPNGWRVTPVGHHIPLPGDLPVDALFTPDGKYLLVHTAGYHDHGVDVIDRATNQRVQHLDLGQSWSGMCLSADGRDLYIAGGGIVDSVQAPLRKTPGTFPKAVLHLTLTGGHLSAAAPLDLPALPQQMCFVSGLAMGKDGAFYVVNMTDNRVSRLSGSPLTVQATGKVFYRPNAVAVAPDGKSVAVTNWGDGTVSLLDAVTLQETASVAVGSHPCALTFAPDGRLFVANAGSNSVSVVAQGQVAETVRTSLDPRAPVGSTPDALAVSPDGKRLYVANADNNDVAVMDISDAGESRVLGFLPTGWYPSALAVAPDGRTLYVGVGKGLTFQANASGKYIGDVLSGALSVVPLPDADGLAADTRRVLANVPVPQSPPALSAARAQGVFAQIHHVVYIIRENRTYDQVFGDMPRGNGDPGLTLFGHDVTPNAHALAEHYVLLDNLYCNGEVSEDGHQWCNAAYATDFTERAWTNSYAGRPEPDADERLTASPAGYLWDNCARHGLTFRSYGEFAGFHSSPGTPPVFTGVGTLKGHASLPWTRYTFDQHDTLRAGVFLNDLHQAEQTGQWPQFMVMSLGEDHTQGTTPGKYTPVAHVAANDQALGQIVAGISRSRFWKDTAIFVIEDDAQDGADHVDAHRTAGLVISPFIRRGVVDSTFYTTASLVHTMEMILGLPPMTQYDTAAQPLFNAFTADRDLLAYDLKPSRLNLEARNTVGSPDALLSARLDLSAPDRADPQTLNAILWHALKPGRPLPAPVRSARLPR